MARTPARVLRRRLKSDALLVSFIVPPALEPRCGVPIRRIKIDRSSSLAPEAPFPNKNRITAESLTRKGWRDLHRAFDKGRLVPTPPESIWIGAFLKHGWELSIIIQMLPWRVVETPPDVILPTSDMPVVLTTIDRRTDGYILGGGWQLEDTEATVPLGPRHVLVIGAAAAADHVGTPEWCAGLPERLVHHSNRFVFARDRSDMIEEKLRTSKPLQYVVQFADQEVRVGDPTGPVVRRIYDVRAEEFRMGPSGLPHDLKAM